ncbi:MAG: hypothetical protein GY953_25805, partial [bacterium]|nr:hypothetical protein [bacterium]
MTAAGKRIGIAALVALLPAAAFAQKEYSARAVQLQRDGRFVEARRAVSAGRRACGSGERARRCHALFYYTAGYIHQQQSIDDPRASAEHLRTAAQYYR